MTTTPWGDATELRARRLRPGPGADPAKVRRNQRERMFGAMVAAVARNGYEATRVADVVEISGVSRSAFYKHFDDKLDCFLATVDAMMAAASERIAAAHDPDLPWEERLRASCRAFAELAAEQPAAARVCLVEIHAAGPQAIERLDAMAAAAERAFARCFDESPERRAMPRPLLRAIVGGIHKTVHTRLRRDEADALPEVMDQLLDWALCYRTPPEALRRPRRRPDRGAAPEPDHQVARERLVTAITQTIAERGYPETTIIEIAERASASLSTFYANFENKEEALLAALERARAHSLATTRHAFEQESEWPKAVRSGLDALFGIFGCEPAMARIAVVEGLAGGPAALEHADRTIWAFHVFVEAGFKGDRRPRAKRQLVIEAIANAVYALIYAQVRAGRAEQMRELTPLATLVVLTPFAGAEDACAVANAPAA